MTRHLAPRLRRLFPLVAAGAVLMAFACEDEENIGTSEEERPIGPRVDSGPFAEIDGGPSVIDGAPPARLSTQLAAGPSVVCAAATDGGTKCWGTNTFGELGIGTESERELPAQIPGLVSSQLAVSLGHVCAVDAARRVLCWGRNKFAELGHPPEADVDAGRLCAGTECSKEPVWLDTLPETNQVAAGAQFSCARGGGFVLCWGHSVRGASGNDGSAPRTGTPTGIAIADVSSIAATLNAMCALKSDGTVWCWGENLFGQVGLPPGAGADAAAFDDEAHPIPRQVDGLSDVKAIAGGGFHTCAILADRTVSCWGDNGGSSTVLYGQLGHAPSEDRTCSAGSICNPKPRPVVGLTGVRELALGYFHSCAVREDDSVWCWGDNLSGALGRDPALDTDAAGGRAAYLPRKVGGLPPIAHVAAAQAATCAVAWDNRVYCWGDNSQGQLGGGSDAGSTFVPSLLKL